MSKLICCDIYSQKILTVRYAMYREFYLQTKQIQQTHNLPIRLPNPPEDITENISKFIIQNYGDDPSCKWAKCLGLPGDLTSDIYKMPEIKSFTSCGPSSFGPNKKFDVLYFLDLRFFETNKFMLWKVNVTSCSPEWKNIMVNKNQTLQNQCDEKRRPHISFDDIYKQISDKCDKIYDGSFEDIFIPKVV